MEAVAELLERTAQQVVAGLDPVEAVVLFGSRARGTAHADSDRDVAVLLDRAPDLSIRAAVPTLEYVNVICKHRGDFSERAHRIGSLESAIVRDGRVLAGAWERPDQSGERIVDNHLISRHLYRALSGVFGAASEACFVLGGAGTPRNLVLGHAHEAAEFTGNAAMLHPGIDPMHMHDLIRLADQLEREGPADTRTARWSAAVRSMNGLPKERRIAAYKPISPELLDRLFEVVSTAAAFFAELFRDIMETRGGFAPHAAEIARAVGMRVENLRRHSHWALIPENVRARLEAWAAEVRRVSRMAPTRRRGTARSPGMRP